MTPESEEESIHIPNPAVYRRGKDIVLVDGAVLPSDFCIKSGKKVASVISISLHNPFHPGTWFKGVQRIMIGLDQQNLEKFRITQTVGLALIGLGVLIIPVGFFSGIGTSIAGLILCLAGFVIRAMIPLWSPAHNKNEVTIRGCGESFLKNFPKNDEPT